MDGSCPSLRIEVGSTRCGPRKTEPPLLDRACVPGGVLPPRSILSGVFERFTDRARRVLVLAQEEARLLNHRFIGTEHILLGLIAEHDGVAAKALQYLGVSLDRAREKVEETFGMAGDAASAVLRPLPPRAKKVLELSL